MMTDRLSSNVAVRLALPITIAVVFLTMSLATEQCSAQGRYQSPSGSPISAAHNNFRLPSGVPGMGDNYRTYVRPQVYLNQALAAQSKVLRQQRQSVSRLTTQVNQLQEFRDSIIAPTGTAARFQYTSHYYPAMSGRRR